MLKSILAILFFVAAISSAATKVGNGDDGSDLENLQPVTSGKLLDSRGAAVSLVESLNVRGIPGLGTLTAEIQNAPLFLSENDISSAETGWEFGAGKVFARTFATPHAATRFFPASLQLSKAQLIALHVHEALHRSLPPGIRENERIVGEITLAITTPDTTHDQVSNVVQHYLPKNKNESQTGKGYDQPSEVGYGYSHFFSGGTISNYSVSSLHSIQSHLYPFGSHQVPFGMGLNLSYLGTSSGGQMGPLGVSLRFRVWSSRGFDVGLWAEASLNTLSAEELKQSPFGRDMITAGISFRKDLEFAYVENRVSISSGGKATHDLGLIRYHYDYGEVINVKLKAGTRLGPIHLGAYAKLHLANYLRVNGGAFNYDSGRFRVFSVGPEIAYRGESGGASLFGRLLVDSTKGADFDYLGNLLGVGVGQGSVGVSTWLNF